MKSELELYKEAHSHLFRALNEVASRTFIDKVFEEVNAILNPAPAYEEVPYERWAVVAPSGYIEATFSDEAQAMEAAAESINAVGKISGTLRQPLPRPVERSVSVKDIQINDIGHPRYNLSPMIVFPEAKGKVVTLTATWTEEGK